MLQIEQVKGTLFDVDDTLLDNGPKEKPELWLHSRSRLAAIHTVAQQRGITALLEVTPQESTTGFMTAKEHTLRSSLWNILFMRQLAADNTGKDAPADLVALVEEIAAEKEHLHESILLEYAVEVPKATAFVQALAAHGLGDHLGIATSAIKRDVDLFLHKYNLDELIPASHTITVEQVSRPKPDPECFDKAFRTLGLPDNDRRNVLAFEDNPKGIASAKGAGLYVCAITTRFAADAPELLAAQPDVIADSYQEFAQLLGLPPLT